MDKKEQARLRKQRQRDRERAKSVTPPEENVTLGSQNYRGNEVSISFGRAMANANRANESKLGQEVSPETIKSLKKLINGG